VAVVCGLVLRNYADLRPQMISFVLLAGLLLALEQYHEGSYPAIRRGLPWAMPVLFVLWANLHGGVIVGLLLVGLWVLGEGIGRWWFHEDLMELVPLALSLLASCVAVCLNPSGYEVYTYPFWVLSYPRVIDYITEWYPVSARNPDMRAFEVLMLATLVLGLTSSERKSSRARDVLMLIATIHAALFAQRNTANFALVAAPVVAGGLGALWRQGSSTNWLRRASTWPAARAFGAVVLAAGLCVKAYQMAPPVSPDRWLAYGTAWDAFPHAAVQQMEQGAWPGRLYNDYVWGGYLLWKLYPKRKVFIDGRAEVYYASGAFDDEMVLHNAENGWQEVLDRRQIDVILTARNDTLANALNRSPDWQRVFMGPAEAVYLRTRKPASLPSALPDSPATIVPPP
jgi:hypothetical protein